MTDTIDCSTFLRREVCEAALRLIAGCRDFGETGEITLEDDGISIEVCHPCGMATAPDKLEDDTVMLKLVDRDPGAGAGCWAGYFIYPKSPSGRARRSKANKEKRRYVWEISLSPCEESQPPASDEDGLKVDTPSPAVVLPGEPPQNYRGKHTPISPTMKFGEKHRRDRRFASRLQTHITTHFGCKGDELTRLLIGAYKINRLGNDINCGGVKQNIDVVVSYTAEQLGYIMPIALQAKPASADGIRQIRRYTDWIMRHYFPKHPKMVAPVLITKATPKPLPSAFVAAAKQFNADKEGGTCDPLRLIEFTIANNNLRYTERKIK